jgi:hypothetical protein
MARERHTPDEIVAKLRQVDVLVLSGLAPAGSGIGGRLGHG